MARPARRPAGGGTPREAALKPRLLDLFCGAGGAAKGYQRAGFYVVGVDNRPQPRYCGDEFIQADALEVLVALNDPEPWEHYEDWLAAVALIHPFDAIHASPPCQAYAGITKVSGDQSAHANLIGPTRDLLERTGLPYVIENVPDARHELRDPIYICGSMFDPPLDVKRHRYFEANWPLPLPTWPCRHKLWDFRFPSLDKRKRRPFRTVPVHGGGQTNMSRVVGVRDRVPYSGEADLRNRAMEIDWMTQAELSQAIPPAYTEWVGHQLMSHIRAEAAA